LLTCTDPWTFCVAGKLSTDTLPETFTLGVGGPACAFETIANTDVAISAVSILLSTFFSLLT